MNLRSGKLERSQRISPALCAALVAALAAVALWLLLRRVRDRPAVARVLRRLAPGLASAACVIALYYAEHGPAHLRLACTAVFLQLAMIALARREPPHFQLFQGTV
jgi:hypothetical protein